MMDETAKKNKTKILIISCLCGTASVAALSRLFGLSWHILLHGRLFDWMVSLGLFSVPAALAYFIQIKYCTGKHPSPKHHNAKDLPNEGTMTKFTANGNLQSSMCFDFDEKKIIITRGSKLERDLGLIDLEIAFDDITGFISQESSAWCGACCSLIVKDHALFYLNFVSDKLNKNLTEISMSANGYKVAESAIAKFRTEIRPVPVYKKGEKEFPKAQYIDGKMAPWETDDTEYRMRCGNCGHVYCYTRGDLKRNLKNLNSAGLSEIGKTAGALTGNWMAAAVNNQDSINSRNKVVNYSRCPKCNSSDVAKIDANEVEIPAPKESASSSIDEIKKYKELLDMGIITQEEFDAKKKQLLGL